MYFVLDKDFNGSLANCLNKTQRSNKNPKGIFDIHAIDDKKYFRITYYPKEMSEKEIFDWVTNIFG